MVGGQEVSEVFTEDVRVTSAGLPGTLRIPSGARALIIFVHGSGSSRFSTRNVRVADALVRRGFATFLFDLLTTREEADRANVFDISLLAQRVVEAVRALGQKAATRNLGICLFGASTGAAAALVTAARLGPYVQAVVSRGGRPDLAAGSLPRVRSPTLLIVGGADETVLQLNEHAFNLLKCEKSLKVISGATHLFPEKGALEAVVEHACQWFMRHGSSVEGRNVLQG